MNIPSLRVTFPPIAVNVLAVDPACKEKPSALPVKVAFEPVNVRVLEVLPPAKVHPSLDEVSVFVEAIVYESPFTVIVTRELDP